MLKTKNHLCRWFFVFNMMKEVLKLFISTAQTIGFFEAKNIIIPQIFYLPCRFLKGKQPP